MIIRGPIRLFVKLIYELLAVQRLWTSDYERTAECSQTGRLPPSKRLHPVTSLQTAPVMYSSLSIPTASLSTCLWNSEWSTECTDINTKCVSVRAEEMNHSETTQAQCKSHQKWVVWGGIYVGAIRDKEGKRDASYLLAERNYATLWNSTGDAPISPISAPAGKTQSHKMNHLQQTIKYVPVYSCFLCILYQSSKPVTVICERILLTLTWILCM